MQHGTETLLAYDTTITFTNKPTNLIFYSNSDKTEAIVIENERYLNLNGFFSLDDNKKRDIPIYWEWKLESGVTQEEIDANDLIDSEFMGKTMSMQIATTGKQVTENPTGKYAVTFDANGGTLPSYGNTSQATKQVTYGETYGNLPTPTREGYTFMGWNGKNLYNVNDIKIITSGITKNSSDWVKIDTSAGNNYYNYWTNNLDILENKQYIIVLEIQEASNITGEFALTSREYPYVAQFEECRLVSSILKPNSIIIKKVKTNQGINSNCGLRTYYSNYNLNINEKLTFRISVLEEQDISADDFVYEPYYITESTQVVQNQNHTLTAIWEPINQ